MSHHVPGSLEAGPARVSSGVLGSGGVRRVWESWVMTFDVVVEVRLREGVADPEGSTIERTLPALGFDGVRDVSVGKSIRFSLEAADEEAARSEVEDLCKRFLTNPVIEDSTITISGVVS